MALDTILIPTVSEGTSCEYHRVVLPFEGLGIGLNKRDHSGAIYFFNRIAPVPPNRRFILDLDDYWELPKTNPFKKAWDDRGTGRAIVRNIRAAQAVFVTNAQLADEVLPYNRKVHVVPNALPFDKGQFSRTVPDFSKNVYAGGISHKTDVEMIEELDVNYFGGLNGSQSLPLSRYMEAYNGQGVSLVPLEDNDFNRCKSNLKVLEAGAKGLACVSSRVLPYYNELDAPYMFYTDDFSWEMMVRSEREFADQADALSQHVRRHYHLKEVNKLRKEILEYYCGKG